MDQAQSSDFTVLIVEPFEPNRRLLEIVFRSVAGRRLAVDCPAAARAHLDVGAIDLVVLEPQGDPSLDWTLLDEVVEAGISVVVLTSRADEDVLKEAESRGAAAVLTKPFQPADLRATALEVLARRAPTATPPADTGTRRLPPLVSRVFPRRVIEGDSHETSSASADDGRSWSAVHRGSIRQLVDRLVHKPTTDSPSADPVMFDPGRVQRASVAWSAVVLAAFGISLTFATSVPFLVWLVLTGIATGITTWASLHPDRSAYDAALPVKVALGVAVGPLAAPLALAAQGVIAGLAKGASTKARWRTTMINIGIFVLEGFTLGLALRFVLPDAQPSAGGWLVLTAGVTAAIGATLAVNYTTVRATLRYLSGQPSPLPVHWGHHARDVAGGTVLALLVAGAAHSGWLAAVGVIAGAGVMGWRLREVRIAQQATLLQLQAHVLDHERQHAALTDHTQQVVTLVEQLIADRPEKDRIRAVAGAWCHTLATGGWPDRCAGAPKPELWDQVRHLPHGWELAAVLEAAGRPRFIHLGELEDLDVATLVGIACAVDSLRLEDGQLHTTQDITDAWGHPKAAVDAVYDLRRA